MENGLGCVDPHASGCRDLQAAGDMGLQHEELGPVAAGLRAQCCAPVC